MTNEKAKTYKRICKRCNKQYTTIHQKSKIGKCCTIKKIWNEKHKKLMWRNKDDNKC